MHSRAAELLKILGMRPHPEGGHYIEVFRSVQRVQVVDRNIERSALTTIYFLLAAGEFTRWHRVMSDEIWHYHEGDAIELMLFDDRGMRRLQLGPVASVTRPAIVVPAGTYDGCLHAGRMHGRSGVRIRGFLAARRHARRRVSLSRPAP